MLSIITIDASTIIPTPRMSPVKVIMFRVIPNMLIAKRVTIIESGIEIEIMIVDLKLCKNMNKITMANHTPCQADSISVLIVSRIASVSSLIISIEISEGSIFFA